MTLTTTLNRLRAADACASRYSHLVRSLGGVGFDHDSPIDLMTILDSNGWGDCIWAMRATVENCDSVARLMAADFAESVLPIFEAAHPHDLRPRSAIEAARKFARGEITDVEMKKHAAAAYAVACAAYAVAHAAYAAAARAAYAAAACAARAAAYAVAHAGYAAAACAARAAAYAVADAAARAAAYAADPCIIIRRYLGQEGVVEV